MERFTVKDEDRDLEFVGQLLSSSSSRKDDSLRWVSFQLYRTQGGIYVVSRTGFSLIYHRAECPLTRKKLPGAPAATLSPQAVPCASCAPVVDVDQAHEQIYPEQPLYWAVAVETAREVIDALTKRDQNKLTYLTHVARNLLRDAAMADTEISNSYFTERVS